MLNPEEITRQEAILEETNEESSEMMRLQIQVPENNLQDISKSELSQVEKWMNHIFWLNYITFSSFFCQVLLLH